MLTRYVGPSQRPWGVKAGLRAAAAGISRQAASGPGKGGGQVRPLLQQHGQRPG